MGPGETLNFWALTLLILPGVLGDRWAVHYPEKEICAVKGSTVVIPCTFAYPGGNKVNTTKWCFTHDKDSHCIGQKYVWHSENENISPAYKGRAKCLGDKKANCTLRIRDIKYSDSGMYKFRFTTNTDSWSGQPGVDLQVSDLIVVMMSSQVNAPVREGDPIKLICKAEDCPLSQSEFIWFKDGQRLPETNATLHLSPVSLNHSGNYSCALQDNRNIVSVPFSLDINDNIIPSFQNSILHMATLSAILLVVIVVGLVIVIYIKRRKDSSLTTECDQGGGVQGGSRQPSNDTYVSLEVKCKVPDYDTLMAVKNEPRRTNTQTSTESPIYENTKMRK